MNMNQNNGTYSMTMEMVLYWYVDRDCTITATGGTQKKDDVTTTYQNVNLKLKRGWNPVNFKVVGNKTTTQSTGTYSFNTGDLSSCKWVYNKNYD